MAEKVRYARGRYNPIVSSTSTTRFNARRAAGEFALMFEIVKSRSPKDATRSRCDGIRAQNKKQGTPTIAVAQKMILSCRSFV